MSFELKKNPKQVIIAGTGHGWELMPKSTNKTVYCLNDYINFKRYQIVPDKLFIMDVLDEKPQIVAGMDNLGDVVSKINKMNVPLISPFKYEEIPLSEAFPLKAIYDRFGTAYFNNTIAYMIAYALLQDVDSIDIYGVNQAAGSEYFYEKPTVEYWLGVANGIGVSREEENKKIAQELAEMAVKIEDQDLKNKLGMKAEELYNKRGLDITIHGDRSELLTNKPRFGGSLLYGYNQTYDQVVNAAEKFGPPIVKKLSQPRRQRARMVRKVKGPVVPAKPSNR